MSEGSARTVSSVNAILFFDDVGCVARSLAERNKSVTPRAQTRARAGDQQAEPLSHWHYWNEAAGMTVAKSADIGLFNAYSPADP